MSKQTWKPNEKQQLFLNVLADGNAYTLAEISEKVGTEIKSGSINTLISKKMVQTEDVVYECNVVRKDNGMIVGSIKKPVKAYRLISKQTEEVIGG